MLYIEPFEIGDTLHIGCMIYNVLRSLGMYLKLYIVKEFDDGNSKLFIHETIGLRIENLLLELITWNARVSVFQIFLCSGRSLKGAGEAMAPQLFSLLRLSLIARCIIFKRMWVGKP
ncbi:hypothetical protein L2E82_16627 [Cichorium intybus]|uniref:Uncharacterized protein n=1 Tax=Cichorium intybus TaxID=13427 RepID=A0ACB9F719_CICIN|nr:hypothetical protein L2E82_16627 [Cichorium intybus]